MTKKNVGFILVLLMTLMGSVSQATTILTDLFDDTLVNLGLWNCSGTATVNSSYLTVKSGGYIQSVNSVSVLEGDIDLSFKNVGTPGVTSSTSFNMQLGLYSADDSQYIKVIQQYAEAAMVQIKGESGSVVSYWLKNASRNLTGPMLRKDSGGQTWRIVLTSNTLKIYVDDVLAISLTAGQTVGYPYGGGTVVIPTANLFAKFLCTSTSCNFRVDEITFSTTYSPTTKAPVFNPAGPSVTQPATITITSATAGASIYYTTDGSTPTTSGTIYSNPTTVTVSDGTVLRAMAVSNGISSWVTGQTYKFAQASAPTFSPGGRYISGPTEITINSEIAGALIYYTLNGNTPTTSGTAYASPAKVTVNNNETLQAFVVAEGYYDSEVTSLTFEIASGYHDPATIPVGSAIVDGNVSVDWADATWTPLDQIYDVTGSTESALNSDIPEAYCAVKWQTNKIYIAVKIRDTAHYFTDSYTSSTARDAIEIYLHTDNNGATAYYPKSTTAQQYAMGLKTSGEEVWLTVGSNGALDLSDYANVATVAGCVDGEWIYYEAAITPFTYLGLLETNDMSTTIISNLVGGEVIGLDVCVVGNKAGTYSGMKAENTITGKWSNWELFGLHQLAAPISGDANLDGAVDVGDLGILAANYGTTGGATWAEGDFNGDGAVDVGDLGILAANYGTGSSSGSSFEAGYAKAFGLTTESLDEASSDDSAEETESAICSGLGLSLIAGLMFMGLMIVKLEE